MSRRAFTLAELLIVITIIAILLGLLYSAIKTVSRYNRETITRGELSNMAMAWKQYYTCYHAWPTNDIENAGIATRYDRSDGDVLYEIGPNLRRMLEGQTITNQTDGTLINPDGVPFIEFTRFENSATPAPVSAWGALRGQRYFVKLDLNGDNMLIVPLFMTNNAVHTNIARRVAVWTPNPEIPGTILGSWQQ